MHAGLIGKHIIENTCEIPVNVYMASEFIYSNPIINKDTLVICVSQSGETIDTLEALKYAQKKAQKSCDSQRKRLVNCKAERLCYLHRGRP